MKGFIFIFALLSSLNGYCQLDWEGVYYIKYEKKSSAQYNKGQIRVWDSTDFSSNTNWSFKAFFKEKEIWENFGYGNKVDSNTLELVITKHRNFLRPNKENNIFKMLEKEKPLYIIKKIDNLFIITTNYKTKNLQLELVKQK